MQEGPGFDPEKQNKQKVIPNMSGKSQKNS
jgi:hypothetical protein